MQLADAIQAWGRAHHRHLSAASLDRLKYVWQTIGNDDAGAMDVATMDADGARRVMRLFDESDRREIAELLNTIRTWSLDASAPAATTEAASDPPEPEPQPEPEPEPPQEQPAVADDAPAPEVSEVVPGMPLDAPVANGPAPPLDAPLSYPDLGPERPLPMGLIAGAALVLIAIAAYFLFIRGDDDPTTVATTDASTTDASTTDGVGAAAGEATDDATTTTGEAVSAVAFTGDDSDDLCALAREYQQNDPLAGRSIFDGAVFFDTMSLVWTDAASRASAEIAPDFAIVQTELDALRTTAAASNFNYLDPAFIAAIENRDFAALDAASGRIDTYFASVCGVAFNSGLADGFGTSAALGTAEADGGVADLAPALTETIEGLSDDEAEAVGNVFLEQLGVSPELAECLNAEIGDVETALAADPALMTREICGTTLAAIMAGVGN